MSTTATPAAFDRRTAPATGNLLVAALILGFFVLACVSIAGRTDVTTGFDEPAHVSYVAHIQHTGDAWPALGDMLLIDPRTFQFIREPNYLNHPPIFYALLAAIGPKLEGHPQALLAYRRFDIVLVAIGLAALFSLGINTPFSRPEFCAYAVPLACIPILVPLASAVNNDDLAFFGGALATVGVWRLVATGRGFWLAVALVGVVAAGWAKLTGLLLTAALVSTAITYLLWRGRMRWTWTIAAGFAVALAAAPYVIYVVQYGSPTPETPAQIALIENGARAAGWADLPRKSFPGYFAHFIVAFIRDWMPALGTWSAFNYAMFAVPVAALTCAVAGFAVSSRRLWCQQETTLDVVVLSGALALAATFALHVGYSYARHVATGWLLDAYPRYYLPLAAIVPLAGLSLLAAIETPRWRAGLLTFLIVGPILYRIFGAPLG